MQFCETEMRTFMAPGAGTTLRVLGGRIVCKASAEDTAGEWELFEITADSGSRVPLHKHAWDEAYFILEGQLDVQIGDDFIEAASGAFVNIPGGVAHSTVNRACAPTRYLLWVCPASVEPFFADLHEASKDGSPDASTIARIAHEHGLQLVSSS